MDLDTSHDSGTDAIDFCNNPLIIDSSLPGRNTSIASYRTIYGAVHGICMHVRGSREFNSDKFFFLLDKGRGNIETGNKLTRRFLQYKTSSSKNALKRTSLTLVVVLTSLRN